MLRYLWGKKLAMIAIGWFYRPIYYKQKAANLIRPFMEILQSKWKNITFQLKNSVSCLFRKIRDKQAKKNREKKD